MKCKFIANNGVEARVFYISNDYVQFFKIDNSYFSSEDVMT